MRIDSQWTFVPTAAPLSLVAAAGVNIPSTVLDLLGQGVGTAPQGIIGNVATFGTDFGQSSGKFGTPKLLASIGTAVTTGDSCTLNLALQLAPDLGSAGGYQPGTWQTVQETGALTAAQLAALTTFAKMDWPPVFPKTLRPRYARLLAQVPAGLNFTAGTISFAGVTFDRDEFANQQAARNYAVS